MDRFLDSLVTQIPNWIYAVLMLVVAFVAATIVKTLMTKLLKALKAEEKLAKLGVKDASTGSSVDFIAKLAYFVTFLLFLPGVLDKLGMNSVSQPITNMVNSFLAFIPKVVGAGIIIAVGVFIAKIVRDLLIALLRATKIDQLQAKAGILVTETSALSTIISNVIYGIILLVMITSALDALGIDAISIPANNIVKSIFDMIPYVLGAIVIIAVGVFISNLVAKLLGSLLAGVGTDKLIEKMTGTSPKKVVLSKLISSIVKYVLIIIFIVQGINVLQLPVLTDIGAAIIGYMPAVLSAVIIVTIGLFAANTAETALVKKFPEAKASALVAKVAIYVLTAFLCLSQLNVANVIVETTFILIIAALCIAFAVAFGVGGRKFAETTLDKLEKKIDDNK
ncbi:MAG: mechanosensitive ion channel [Lachnospiraceae bacterium]|nr:mechanosensitive ion channel [Lachnospiraceae bacterium]MDE6744467.1 mechanosensitive ion channel [Lachnospiraceae bacterium]